MTRYHRKWDRRGRLLNAVQRLLNGINYASNASVLQRGAPRGPDAARLYARSVRMVARIKRELEHG